MKRFLFLSLCCLFLWTGLTEAACAETDSAQPQDSIKALYDNFMEYVGRTDLVTPGELQKLPVGMRTTIGNTNYDLLFTDAVFGADYTELAVYLRISGPDWQGGKRELFFGADKVLISNKGGYIGDVKLALMGDVVFKDKGDRFCLRFLGRGENSDYASSKDGLPPTYAIVNCKGFQELQISAELSVTDENIVFIDHGERTDEPLRTTFFCNAKSLDDIVVSLSLPEFGLKNIPDWSFAAEKVTLDFSQTRNAPGFESYKLSGGNKDDVDFSELWQGLYMEGIRLRFPDYIKKVDGASPTVEARKFWVDEHGCTGLFAATDLLRLDEGSLGGWGFSVKEFSFQLERNRLVEGGMKGSVQIPVSTANSYSYAAKFAADGTWDMTLKLDKKASFDFIKAREVELYATSTLKMKKEKNKPFLIEANLSGKMKLNPTASENDKFGFGNFEFQGLKIRNQSPYFEVNRIEWDDELKVGNFPVSIRDLEIHAKKSDISLGFKTQVHIGDKSDASFGGDLSMAVKSAVEENADGKQKWNYKSVDIDEVKIDFSNSFITFAGGVKFIKGHKIYGNGFQGMLDFKIEPLGGLGLRADMMFGSTSTYRYWYADVLARLGAAGIPVFPGFKIAAIGGGAYKHMSMQSFSGPLATPGDFGEDTDDIGQTSTGLRYEPDSTKSLGLKTAVVLALQDEKVFNAELTFDMLFNKNGGVSRITLEGVGNLMVENNINIANFNQKITDLAAKIQPSVEEQRKAASADASVTANVKLDMDFSNHAFTGLFDVYMDLGVIKGAGTRGHMGQMGMYFGRDDWYVKVGEPAKPLAVQLKVGPLQANAGAYFMTGSRLPDFPGPSAKLQTLLKSSYPRPDLSELREGAGLAFGSNFHLSTGTIPILIFYAAFDAEVGFDIMMKKYPGTLCQETGSAPGIKGWYAQGQAYSYMMTDVGLYLKLFGQKRNFSVLRGEVGALLRAGLPNPASFEGSLGVNVSLLNGLVRGKFNLNFNLGQNCTMMQQGFADGADVISSTLPEKDSRNVDVFSVPQAAFNFPVETEIVEEYDRQERKMKINLDRYELWYGGTKLQGKFEYDQDKRVVKFLSHDMLPANATLDFKLAVGAREKKGASWTALKDEKGKDYTEDRIYTFRTASAPDSIPWSNVQYCYPVRNQEHYLPEETDKGFVFLKRGMADLFTDPDYSKRLVLRSESDSLSVAFTYNQAERRVMWTMPKGLKPSTEYELRLVLEYKGASAQVSGAQQTSALQNATVYASEGGALEQETVTLTASASKSDKDKTVLCYRFKTGLFKDFKSKMEAVNLSKTYRTPIIYMNAAGYAYVNDPDVHYLQANMKSQESFCENERQGTLYSGYAPLVQASADLSEEPYYNEDIHPLVYEKYPYNGTVEFEREEGREGLIPTWAVYPSAIYREGSTEFFPWIYALPVQYKKDFNAVLGAVAHNSVLTQSSYYAWLGKNFRPIRNGSYPVVLRYVLPDGTVTSEVKVNFENK